MKICFAGLGSIGMRHLKNLADILKDRKIPFSVDSLRSTDRELSSEIKGYLDREYQSADDLPNDYDIILITNPTARHYETAMLLKDKAKNLFIEKPVFDRTDYDTSVFENAKGIIYVACPLRYTEVIRYMKDILKVEEIYAVRAICSSYLPEWRPETDYRDTYSSQKKTWRRSRIGPDTRMGLPS